MNDKALAILDMALKISQATPADVSCSYLGAIQQIDIFIYWDGLLNNSDNRTVYYAPFRRDPEFDDEITPDEMLRILEEIWAAAQAKEEIS